MPVDLGVFERQKTIVDQQQLQDAFELKKAMAAAELQKALKPNDFNLNELGQKALIKQQLGIPLTPEDSAYANVYNAATQGIYTDVQGNVVQRPGVMDRLGGAIPPIQQPTPQGSPQAMPKPAPIAQGSLPPQAQRDAVNGLYPTAAPATPFREAMGASVTNPASNLPLVPDESKVNNFIGANPLPLTPSQKQSAKMQEELAGARGNPKLEQVVKEKYATANSPQMKFEQENKLRDEFNGLTKDFRSLQDAYSKVQNISDTAAGDIALLYATAKLNDPGSVVRESEFAVQASAGSLGDRWKNAVGKIQSGQRLTESQRQQLKAETDNLYKAQRQNYDQIKSQYKGIAFENQLNDKNVIAEYAQPSKPSNYQQSKAAFDERNGYKTKSGVTYKVIK